VDLNIRVRNSPLRNQLDSSDVVCVWAPDQGRTVGVIVQTDSTGKKAKKFIAIDPDFGVRLVNAMDTTAALEVLRAQRYAAWLDWKPRDTLPSLPIVAYRTDTLIHVWVIPAAIMPVPSSHPSVGGERHYVFPADAKKELYAVPPPKMHTVKGETAGEWVIETTDSIPTFSELLMAHMLRMDERAVTIVTPTRVLKLSGGPGAGSGPGVVGWVILPKKP
jgi:hypothetical protein